MSFDPRLIDMVMRLRSRGVSDSRVLRAVEQTPRRPFLPDDMQARAYDEAAVPVQCGQTALAPLDAARLLQVLRAGPDDKALFIGSGTGWTAAVLSRLCRRVYAVERYVGLVRAADAVLAAQALHKVEIRHGDGRYGWPGQAPFSRIVFGCAVRAVPDKVMDQLAREGRLVAVVDGQLTLFEKARTRVTETAIAPMTLPMIEAGKSRAL